MFRIFNLIALFFLTSIAMAEVSFQKVTTDVYAYVGPLENRTEQNLGLNNNIGLINTSEGLVLIDSGAGDVSAKALQKAAAAVSEKPIVAVINIGSQDHRWLGNNFFAKQGINIISHQKTVKTQKRMGSSHLEKMAKVSDIFQGTQLAHASIVLTGEKPEFMIGGKHFQMHYLGDAHFPGDVVLWMPNEKVLFSGDLIYVDRMLGVHPFSKVASWQQAFHKATQFPALYIVPGHGQVCDWDKAKQDTGNYLDKLVSVMQLAAEDMLGVDDAVSENVDWPEFKHLEHYDSWHKTILNRTYIQFEEQM